VADRRDARLASHLPIERSIQTLPIPLGGLAPVRRHSTWLRRTMRTHRSVPVLILALACAASGVWLSVAPRPFEAGEDTAGIHIDGITLMRMSQSTASVAAYTGDATVVIHTAPSGVITAAAVMTWNGTPAKGRCVLRGNATGSVEMCVYEVGSVRLTSTDRFTEKTRTWQRRYDDGLEIVIGVPVGSTVIPIPFPLGH
jgi:hypothetical protein